MKETAESVVNLTNSHWEWILVDDGSNVETKAYCEILSEKYANIKYIVREGQKKGAPVCRNIGLNSATFDFIWFLDSDDLIGSNSIYYRLEIINNNPGMDFWVFPVALFNKTPHDLLFLVNNKDERNDLDRFCFGENIWQTLGVIWSKEYLNKIGGFNEELPSFQDWELSIRSLLYTEKYFYDFNLNPSAFYRQTEGESISNKRFNEENALANSKMILDVFSKMKLLGKVSELRRTHLLNFYVSRLNYWTFVETKLSRSKMILDGLNDAKTIGLISSNDEEQFLKDFLLLYVSKINALLRFRRNKVAVKLKSQKYYQTLILRESYKKIPYQVN